MGYATDSDVVGAAAGDLAVLGAVVEGEVVCEKWRPAVVSCRLSHWIIILWSACSFFAVLELQLAKKPNWFAGSSSRITAAR